MYRENSHNRGYGTVGSARAPEECNEETSDPPEKCERDRLSYCASYGQ